MTSSAHADGFFVFCDNRAQIDIARPSWDNYRHGVLC